MLTRKEFVQIIKDIQENDEAHNELTKVLGPFCDGAGFLFTGDIKIYKNLLMLLRREMHDEGDLIGWWLYEDVEKVLYVEDREYEVKTAEQLYDFLLDNRE